MNRWKEVAKFACGATAFDALAHAYFGFSDMTLTLLFGITMTPAGHLAAALLNAVVSLMLGLYAWGHYERRTASGI